MKTTRTPFLVGLALGVGLVASACSAGAPATPSPTPIPLDAPVTSPPDGGGIDPGQPVPSFVVPQPGQLQAHPVRIDALTPTVDGRHVTVQADWVSGIEPCNVLDRIEVTKAGTTVTIALFEGASDLNVACIEIAVYKATMVDLGELEPGSYVVEAADGSAPPASFTVQ
jgi:hypothetical protein